MYKISRKREKNLLPFTVTTLLRLKWLKERLKNALRSLFFEIWAFRGRKFERRCVFQTNQRLKQSLTRRERLKSALYLRLKKRKTFFWKKNFRIFFSFGKCRTVPKTNQKGDPLVSAGFVGYDKNGLTERGTLCTILNELPVF